MTQDPFQERLMSVSCKPERYPRTWYRLDQEHRWSDQTLTEGARAAGGWCDRCPQSRRSLLLSQGTAGNSSAQDGSEDCPVRKSASSSFEARATSGLSSWTSISTSPPLIAAVLQVERPREKRSSYADPSCHARQTAGGPGILQMTRPARRHGALKPMAALYAPHSCRSSTPYTDVHRHDGLRTTLPRAMQSTKRRYRRMPVRGR
jgi:hypothetical protein